MGGGISSEDEFVSIRKKKGKVKRDEEIIETLLFFFIFI